MKPIEYLESLDKTFLTAADVAPYLECDPIYVREKAHTSPETLGFPVLVMRRRVKIPKQPFIDYIKWARGI